MITYLISVYMRVANRIKLRASSRSLTRCISVAFFSFITLLFTTRAKTLQWFLILRRKFRISLNKTVLLGNNRGANDSIYIPFTDNPFNSLSRFAAPVRIIDAFVLSVTI